MALAKMLNVPHTNIAFWEWSEKPPRSDIIPQMAKILGVGVDQLLGTQEALGRHRSGPVGKLERVLEEARQLSRRDQELVVQFVSTLVEQRKKAS